MILCCIPTRDWSFNSRVLMKVSQATEHAAAAGVNAIMQIGAYPYGVAMCRNKATHGFMQHKEFDRLFFIDDDVLIPPETITTLAAVDADIVAGCYGSVRIDPEEGSFSTAVWVQPVAGGYDVTEDGWCKHWFDGIIDAQSVGGGCMMIRRHVFEKVGFPWFQWPEAIQNNDIKCQSDDGNFCDRAAMAGCTIKAHGGIRCGHLKTINVSRLIGVLDGA